MIMMTKDSFPSPNSQSASADSRSICLQFNDNIKLGSMYSPNVAQG